MVLELLKIIHYKKENWINNKNIEIFENTELYKIIKIAYKIFKSSKTEFINEWLEIGDILKNK